MNTHNEIDVCFVQSAIFDFAVPVDRRADFLSVENLISIDFHQYKILKV